MAYGRPFALLVFEDHIWWSGESGDLDSVQACPPVYDFRQSLQFAYFRMQKIIIII